MKPTHQSILPRRRLESCSLASRASQFPKTDYQFRSDSFTDFAERCQGASGPSFRGISDDYFKKEARGHFLAEATMFVLIAVTAGVPIIQGIRLAIRAAGLL